MFVYNAILCSYIFLIDFLRCVESGVSYLSSKVESIVEATNGHSLVACDHGIVIPSRYDIWNHHSIQVFSDGIPGFLHIVSNF